MSDFLIVDMRTRLLKLREELESMAATGDQSSQVVELDQTRMGRLSRMDALQAQAMSVASKQRREWQLQQITAVLSRIDSDDFGWCLD